MIKAWVVWAVSPARRDTPTKLLIHNKLDFLHEPRNRQPKPRHKLHEPRNRQPDPKEPIDKTSSLRQILTGDLVADTG